MSMFADCFGLKMGTYSVYSKSDTRFNKSWRKEGLVCMGRPSFVDEWVQAKVKELNLKDYPSDLMYSFFKD